MERVDFCIWIVDNVKQAKLWYMQSEIAFLFISKSEMVLKYFC